MSRKQWEVSKIDKELASLISERHGVDPFIGLLLVSKNITDDSQIEEFFSDGDGFADPFEIKDMDKAVQRINLAMDTGEKFAVYGDYDADGVTATSVLSLFFELGGCNFVTYIPSREQEGYGLNCKAIDKLHEQGVSLIITVDNGISAIEEAKYIASLGMDLIVTDHHTVGSQLPQAVAVVDPHRKDCPSSFKHLCGAGVALKLICALSECDYDELIDSFCDIVAIGTVADIVSLTGENRYIVKKGVDAINAGNNIGISALRQVAGVDEKDIDSTTIAFSISPRINALGRVSHAKKAVQLLTSDNFEKALEIANEINEANNQRKQIEQEIVKDVEKAISANPKILLDDVLIFANEGWHAGVIGIVCAKMVEKYGKPCIMISIIDGEARGSGRSVEGFSLYAAIDNASDILTHFGGHIMAAGFSLDEKNLPEFKNRIKSYCKTVQMPFAKVKLDLKLNPAFISVDILDTIAVLEPFGQDNQEPIFGLYSMKILDVQPLGKTKAHVKITLEKNGAVISALYFGVTPEQFAYKIGDEVDLAVNIKKNEYASRVSVSIYLKYIKMSKTSDELYLNAFRLYEKIKRGEKPNKQLASSAVPDRNIIAAVFRFIKKEQKWAFDFDVLCYRLGDSGQNAAKILFAIDILAELSILNKQGETITINSTQNKVNLEDSKILTYLNTLV